MEPKWFLMKGLLYGYDNLIFTGEINFLLNFKNHKFLLNDTKITYNSIYQLYISPETLR
jgi:hypothetical protein